MNKTLFVGPGLVLTGFLALLLSVFLPIALTATFVALGFGLAATGVGVGIGAFYPQALLEYQMWKALEQAEKNY